MECENDTNVSFFLICIYQFCIKKYIQLKNKILVLLLLLNASGNILFACSAFFCKGERKIFGKNFDWGSGEGFIIKNNRSQIKYSYGIRGSNQAHWVSRYGSFTFNQIGKENPYGGMNETGLIVEQLWLNSSYYQDNNNNTISELEWIQFQLDNYSSVTEIIENINNLTIQPTKATVHYFVADKDGKSAVIDFVNGKTVISASENNFQVITNSTYSASLNYLSKFGKNIDSNSRSSEDRFCQITNNLSRNNIKEPQQAFDILDASAEERGSYKTYWTIVYDIDNKVIHYKSYHNKSIKIIRLNDFSYENNDTISGCKINENQFNLEKYTSDLNSSILSSSLQMMNLKLDNQLANEHQMNPGKNSIDTIYKNNYIDIKLIFKIKNKTGILFYTFIQGEEDFKRKKGIFSAMIHVSDNIYQTKIYTFPKGDYAIASFHDLNSDHAMDKGFLGIPKAFAFSNNAKGFFGLPPKYRKAKIHMYHNTELSIDIK